MRILMLIPSIAKTDIEEAVATDAHPRMDYHALRQHLWDAGHTADILDYAVLADERSPLIRMAAKIAGKDVGLALLANRVARAGGYDAVFSNSESVSIPLALCWKGRRTRPGHVVIAHRLSTGKKQIFFRRLRVHQQMDTLIVYASAQVRYGVERLGIPVEKMHRIEFHADTHFYRPLPDLPVDANQICSMGLEWRDYPTLISAITPLTHLKVRFTAYSPWSKYTNETEKRELPSHVEVRRYDYPGLRELYATSACVVVPLYENDFSAGITTVLEGMAMGKAVIVTRTTGQTDVVVDGVNGLAVPPGDGNALRDAIVRLQQDADLRATLGENAYRWAVKNATLPAWVDNLSKALYDSVGKSAPDSA